MARPTLHTMDGFLDAAADLFGAGGAEAVTMTAVAERAGAPSGSLYHRFTDRPQLLAHLWARTVESYRADAWSLFAAPPVDAAAALATHTVTWCRTNARAAKVLHAGRRAVIPPAPTTGTPSEIDTRIEAEQARWDREVDVLVRAVRAETELSTSAVLLAVVDLPLAAITRYLATDRTVPADLADVTGRAVRTLLAGLGPETHLVTV